MKIRFGFTIGPEVTPDLLGPVVDHLERLRFDSLWVPESLLQSTMDPIVALSFAASRTDRLKLGTHVILPGRHPVHLARQLAQLDCVAQGRLLLLGVLGLPQEADVGAQGIERRERAAAIEEMVPLLRQLWTGEPVTHDGARYQFRDVALTPTPHQQPLELWLAGQAPSALRRCGRHGDGWMPGLILPHEAAELRAEVDQAAIEAGRTMDPEHYGANLFYATQPLPAESLARLASRRPEGDAADLVPVGWEALHARIDQWVEAGFSKFLLRPLVPPTDWERELETLAGEVLTRTT